MNLNSGVTRPFAQPTLTFSCDNNLLMLFMTYSYVACGMAWHNIDTFEFAKRPSSESACSVLSTVFKMLLKGIMKSSSFFAKWNQINIWFWCPPNRVVWPGLPGQCDLFVINPRNIGLCGLVLVLKLNSESVRSCLMLFENI